MSITPISIGLPGGMAGWKLLQGKSVTDFKGFIKDPALQRDLAYLRETLPTKATAKDFLADRRLQEMVLKAYGLSAQVGMNALMQKVLDSDLSDNTSVAWRMNDSRYRKIAAALNYGGAVAAKPAVASSSILQVAGLDSRNGFATFSGNFGGVNVEGVSLLGKTSTLEIAATLQAAFRKADGGAADISVTTLGNRLIFKDAKGRGAASDLSLTTPGGSRAGMTLGVSVAGSEAVTTGKGPVVDAAAVPATPSVAKVRVDGLMSGGGMMSFSGTLGDVSVGDVSLLGQTSLGGIASVLQAAFRKADNGAADISVTVSGNRLIFQDARGRGKAAGFDFSVAAGSSLVTTLSSNAAGKRAKPATGEAVAATPSSAMLELGALAPGDGLKAFSGTFGGIMVSDVALDGKTSGAGIAAAMQAAFRRADGNATDISVTYSGTKLVLKDAKGRGKLEEFGFQGAAGASAAVRLTSTAAGNEGTPAAGAVIPSVASGATVKLEGFSSASRLASFSGSFGGLTLEDVPLSGAATREDLAATLQAAFRKADNGATDISVSVLGTRIVFKDARGRGKLEDFAFGKPGGSLASATLAENAAGQKGSGGAGSAGLTAATVEEIVGLYTQSLFEESLGGSSESLRRAVYAKRTLPGISNWYSVISDRNLAAVVQGVLGLPDSFAQIDVDQQKATLERRMDIADFKDPAKLSKLLERYVAMSSIEEAKAFASANSVAALVQPISWGGDSFSGASSAALFSILGSG
jgi:hypothetical protein